MTTAAADVPVIIDWSWHTSHPALRSYPLQANDDAARALLFYADGTVRFKHTCDRGRRGVVVCAPALQTGPHGTGHTVTRSGDSVWAAATVSPSILCEDCSTHGFITDGTWRDA